MAEFLQKSSREVMIKFIVEERTEQKARPMVKEMMDTLTDEEVRQTYRSFTVGIPLNEMLDEGLRASDEMPTIGRVTFCWGHSGKERLAKAMQCCVKGDAIAISLMDHEGKMMHLFMNEETWERLKKGVDRLLDE